MAIDPKTLRSGDVVLVRAVYSHSADRWKHAVSVGKDDDLVWVKTDDIASVVARQIRQADRVRFRDGTVNAVFRVVHIDDDTAFIRLIPDGTPLAAPLARLELDE